MLDDQAAQILGVTDAIAERVRKTGNTTLRSIGDIARHQTIEDNDDDFVAPPTCWPNCATTISSWSRASAR